MLSFYCLNVTVPQFNYFQKVVIKITGSLELQKWYFIGNSFIQGLLLHAPKLIRMCLSVFWFGTCVLISTLKTLGPVSIDMFVSL